MKQPKKLTRSQKEFLAKKGLNPDNWMLAYEDSGIVTFIHKTSCKTRSFDK